MCTTRHHSAYSVASGHADNRLGIPMPDDIRPEAPTAPYFAAAEFDARLAAVRRAMAARDLDTLLVSAPENVFYLVGLDHWGYFTPHVLVVPAEGELTLVTRA